MATIIRKTKKGRPYYYAVESQRVDGKPRIVWQKYLGTLESILQRAERSSPSAPKEAVIFQLGGPAALLGIAQRLELEGVIDRVVAKRDQGPSVGRYMLLAAINRALAPCSKVAIGDWYEKTVLRRLWRIPKSAFTSQRFWDHMDRIPADAIEEIEEEVLKKVIERFHLGTDVLLYDTTNFFTFLSSTNDRSELAQRGKAKSKRDDLRLVGLALMVTRDFQVPLLHHTYAGNIPDVALFSTLSSQLMARHRRITGASSEATLVFDKGNLSADAMESLVVEGTHFVAAAPANTDYQLAATPLEHLRPLPGLAGTRALSVRQEHWGVTCHVVVVYTESFFTQQLAGVTHNLVKCQERLADLSKQLERRLEASHRGRRFTVRGVQRTVREILSAQFMQDLFDVSVTTTDGQPRIEYALNQTALRRLTEERLGRTLLLTTRTSWDPATVVRTYRSLAGVEEAFKRMKNSAFLHWQPAYHWTDQKLRVHSFYCVLGLLLATLAHRQAHTAGIDVSLPGMLKQLGDLNEVAVIYPPGTLAHRKDHVTLTRMSPAQRRLADCLHIAEVARAIQG